MPGSFCGSSMDPSWNYSWIIPGSSPDHSCIFSGSSLDQSWIIPGSSLNHSWIMHESSMDEDLIPGMIPEKKSCSFSPETARKMIFTIFFENPTIFFNFTHCEPFHMSLNIQTRGVVQCPICPILFPNQANQTEWKVAEVFDRLIRQSQCRPVVVTLGCLFGRFCLKFE